MTRPLEFPTYLFHADGRIVRVSSRDQADALGSAWTNDPSVSAGIATTEVPLIKVMQDQANVKPEPFHMPTHDVTGDAKLGHATPKAGPAKKK